MTTPWASTRPGRHGFPPKIARYIIRRDKTCQLAYPPTCVGTPGVADHITPWAEAVALGWTPGEINHPDNGQAACAPCHAVKTQAEAQRGRARAKATRQQRRTKPHPGLKPQPLHVAGTSARGGG